MNTDELPVLRVKSYSDVPNNYTGIIEYYYGDKYWYKNGIYHREDGPAIEYYDGTKTWYKNGKWHREDGPACEWKDGSKWWCLNGKRYSFEKFFELTTDEGKEALIWRMDEYR